MKHLVSVLTPLLLVVLTIGSSAKTEVTADSVLAELKAGNAHHVAHHYQHPHESASRQRELTSGQNPHAQIFRLR